MLGVVSRNIEKIPKSTVKVPLSTEKVPQYCGTGTGDLVGESIDTHTVWVTAFKRRSVLRDLRRPLEGPRGPRHRQRPSAVDPEFKGSPYEPKIFVSKIRISRIRISGSASMALRWGVQGIPVAKISWL